MVLLGFEDVLVAHFILAHLPGNDFGERIECTLLVKVPAGILLEKDLDEVVELSVLGGPDGGRPGCMRTVLPILWWHLVVCCVIIGEIIYQ